MNVTAKPQAKSTTLITVELSPEEMQPHLDRAAEKLSKEYKIEGFRPGKASVGIVIQKLGAQHVWEEAAELAVRKTFVDVVAEQKLNTVGRPKVSIVKLAADNPFIYTAEVALLPDVQLENYQEFKTKRKPADVSEEKINAALEDLRGMFAKETAVDRPIQDGDKAEVDFDLHVDHVLVEGGSSKQHPIIVGSKQFIPGFEENLIGLKTGESKTFTLDFPKEYHNPQVAGKKGEFSVTVKTVFNIEKPEVNDDFAKQAGQFKNLEELKEKLKENLKAEADREIDNEFERDLLDELIKRTKFGELPELLIDSELGKMMEELQSEVERQGGLKFSDYLQGLKKTEDDLKKDFRPQAERRVKSALVIRHIALAEKVDATKEEIETEIQPVLKMYSAQPEIMARIDTTDYRDYIKNLLINRKVVQMIKDRASKASA